MQDSLKSWQWLYKKKKKKNGTNKTQYLQDQAMYWVFYIFYVINGNWLFDKIGHSHVPWKGWLSGKHAPQIWS